MTSTNRIRGILGGYAAQGRALQREARASEFREHSGLLLPLAALQREDISLWSPGRLRLWAHRGPWMLLAALGERGAGVDLSGYPRKEGAPPRRDLAQVADWGVVVEASGDLAAWVGLYRFLLERLYPEYRERTRETHPCQERVLWLGENLRREHLPPLLWRIK